MKQKSSIRFVLAGLALCLTLCFGAALALADEAAIGSTSYATLQAAIGAAGAGDTVTLLSDVTLPAGGAKVITGKRLTIDLAGHTIGFVHTENSTSATILNDGDLTINDSVGGGTITNNATQPAGDPWPYANNTITNRGKLTINGGNIINTAQGGACFAVDCNTTLRDTSLTVNGGTIEAWDCGIRSYANSGTFVNKVEINGGSISGAYAYWIQLPSDSNSVHPPVDVDINGGELTGTGSSEFAIYSYSNGNSYDGVDINITGGTFVGDIVVGGGSGNGGLNAEKVRMNSAGRVYGVLFSYNKTNYNIHIRRGKFDTYYANYCHESDAEGETITYVETPDDAYYEVGPVVNVPGGGNVYVIQAGDDGALTVESDGEVTVLNEDDTPVTVNGTTLPAYDGGDECPFIVIGGKTPDAPAPANLPTTGDSFPMAGCITLMLAALAAMVALKGKTKKA